MTSEIYYNVEEKYYFVKVNGTELGHFRYYKDAMQYAALKIKEREEFKEFLERA